MWSLKYLKASGDTWGIRFEPLAPQLNVGRKRKEVTIHGRKTGES